MVCSFLNHADDIIPEMKLSIFSSRICLKGQSGVLLALDSNRLVLTKWVAAWSLLIHAVEQLLAPFASIYQPYESLCVQEALARVARNRSNVNIVKVLLALPVMRIFLVKGIDSGLPMENG